MGKESIDVEQLKRDKKAKKDEARKISQQSKAKTQQMPPPIPLRRVMHPIPNRTTLAGAAGSFTLMTYNILAQCLIKRHLFPDSGDMLKWKIRRKMIPDEIAYYKPDILCLQEVDSYDEFYKDALHNLGYETEFFHHTKKNHGLLIGFKSNLFECVAYKPIDYDADTLCPATWITGNIAQIMALRHKTQRLGLILGNTHMYWRPEAVYERLRQTAVYCRRLNDLKKDMQKETPSLAWQSLLIGDFNTAPDDPNYAALTMTALPSAKYDALENSRLSPGAYVSADTINGEDGAPLADQPTVPVIELVGHVHTAVPSWTSVYGCYGEIHPTVAHPSGEPKFTNYTAAFKGTLDYIFYNASEDLAPQAVLEIPNEELVQPTLPNRMFGSDHVCLMTQFAFLIQ